MLHDEFHLVLVGGRGEGGGGGGGRRTVLR